MKDMYGIYQTTITTMNAVFNSSRRTGRTYKMIESLKDDDMVIFANAIEADRVRKICWEKGVAIKTVVVDPAIPSKIWEVTRGIRTNIVYDHSWLEKYYRHSIMAASKYIDNIQNIHNSKY